MTCPRDDAQPTDIFNPTAGAENIYIHVHKDNLPAWRLYDKIGFKVYGLFVVCFILIFFCKINTHVVYLQMVDHQDGARHSSDLCLLSFSS